MDQARSLIKSCGCISGCPACVGPIEEVGLLGKKLALELLAAARRRCPMSGLRERLGRLRGPAAAGGNTAAPAGGRGRMGAARRPY